MRFNFASARVNFALFAPKFALFASKFALWALNFAFLQPISRKAPVFRSLHFQFCFPCVINFAQAVKLDAKEQILRVASAYECESSIPTLEFLFLIACMRCCCKLRLCLCPNCVPSGLRCVLRLRTRCSRFRAREIEPTERELPPWSANTCVRARTMTRRPRNRFEGKDELRHADAKLNAQNAKFRQETRNWTQRSVHTRPCIQFRPFRRRFAFCAFTLQFRVGRVYIRAYAQTSFARAMRKFTQWFGVLRLRVTVRACAGSISRARNTFGLIPGAFPELNLLLAKPRFDWQP